MRCCSAESVQPGFAARQRGVISTTAALARACPLWSTIQMWKSWRVGAPQLQLSFLSCTRIARYPSTLTPSAASCATFGPVVGRLVSSGIELALGDATWVARFLSLVVFLAGLPAVAKP